VRFQDEFLLRLGRLNQFDGFPVGFDANEYPNFLGVCERGLELVKAADKKITDKAIEEARVVSQQYPETVCKTLPVFVRDECEVRGHG
jgi:hypothetical protein